MYFFEICVDEKVCENAWKYEFRMLYQTGPYSLASKRIKSRVFWVSLSKILTRLMWML